MFVLHCWLYYYRFSYVGLGFVFASPGFSLFFLVLAKRLAGKSIPEMTYFVLSETLSIHSVSHIIIMHFIYSTFIDK